MTVGHRRLRLRFKARDGALILLILAGLTALVARLLFEGGFLYGSDQQRAFNLGIAALMALGVIAMFWPRLTDAGAAASTLAVSLSIATVTFGIMQTLVRNTPAGAAAPACPGASVQGSRFLAQTQTGIGVNARRGPGRQYEQINRFPGGCSLGFDGFCVGEPIPDFVTDEPDVRWLLLHRAEGVVASGKIQSQSPERSLGRAPAGRCSSIGGLPLSPPVSLSASIEAKSLVHLLGRSRGAGSIGYAIYFATPLTIGGFPYAQIGLTKDVTPQGFPSDWDAAYSGSFLPGGRGEIDVLAVVCFAPTVPQLGSGTLLRFVLDGDSVARKSGQPRLTSSEVEALERTACESLP
jgi:hypothetical protein